MPDTDVLILTVARAQRGLSIAGMTTERDPTTGLRWVRPVLADQPFDLDMLRYDDGSLIRPGDVVRLPLEEPRPEPPHIENTLVSLQYGQLERVRRLSGERLESFFVSHLDMAPSEVLRDRQRSICLVRPDFAYAVVSHDLETGKFETRLAVAVGKLRSNEEGIAVTDVYWRALMRTWLGDEEYMELDDGELQKRLGDMYIVIGLGKRGPLILGVHTIPEYDVTLDEDAL